jgi:hypothetical protein
MPEPVAPRLLGADADAGIVLIEDLGPGPSLADSLLTGDRSRVRADLVSYAEALGSMHAWSMRRPRGPSLGTPPWPGAVARGKDAFLGAAAALGLSAAGAGTEVDQLCVLLNETGYHDLVHGDACPDNVRFLDGRCRIFDFEHSGGGHHHDAAPAAHLAAQLHFRGGPVGRASRPSCPGRRTAPAAIGALAGDGHRGLPGSRRARFGAGPGTRLLAAGGVSGPDRTSGAWRQQWWPNARPYRNERTLTRWPFNSCA